MKPATPCQSCGSASTFPGARLCSACYREQVRRERERAFVPLYGGGKRLSGRTGTCPVCKRRGCMACEGK